MLLSFIIPVYNAENFIQRCLEAILSQTGDHFEVIAIDDASTDHTYEKLVHYAEADHRLRIYRNEAKKLTGYCRNKGMQLALGEYFWFVDADDWISSNAMSHVNKIIESNPDAQVFSFGFAEHYKAKDDVIFYKLPHSETTKDKGIVNFLTIRRGYSSMPFSYIFKRDFITDHSLNFPQGLYFEDLLFMGQVFYYVQNISLIPRIFYNYDRTNPDSITLYQSKKKILDLIEIYERLLNFLQSHSGKQYQDLLAFRFVLYGLPRCFRMYFCVPMKERKDKLLRCQLRKYKESELMAIQTIRRTGTFATRLSATDPFQRLEFRRNLRMLLKVKYASGILEFMSDFQEVMRIGKDQLATFRSKISSLHVFNRQEL